MKKILITASILILLGFSVLTVYGALLQPSRPGGLLSPLNLSDIDLVVKSLSVDSLTGFLYANNGAVTSTSTVSSQWTSTSTGIFYNGGRVGIGTASPDHALTVSGNGHFTQGLTVDNLTTATSTFSGSATFGGSVGIGTTTPNSTLQVYGNFSLTSSSTITTASIGGSALIAGDCASATTTIDSTVSSSTAKFITTPTSDPGAGNWSYSFLSSVGVLTTRVCAAIAETPNATTYNVGIIK